LGNTCCHICAGYHVDCSRCALNQSNKDCQVSCVAHTCLQRLTRADMACMHVHMDTI